MKLSTWIFLRGLAIVYVIAFTSAWVQVDGLFGETGILPVADYLSTLKTKYGTQSYIYAPSLVWFAPGSLSLNIICGLGLVLSIFLFLGFFTSPILFLLYLGYLSLVNVGQVFFSYQWDALLLEAGFLAIFVGSFRPKCPLPRAEEPAPQLLFLLRFLLFKLMFLSGLVKLSSGDPAWSNLTALTYHYYTQPIPNPISYYIFQLPISFHHLSCLIAFVIELVVPFFIFFKRKYRLFAAVCFVSLQTIIFFTGNFTFFNILTILLCLTLIGDEDLKWAFPTLKTVEDKRPYIPSRTTKFILNVTKKPTKYILITFLVLFSSLNVVHIITRAGHREVLPDFVNQTVRSLSAFRISNNYGLFAVMTKSRAEIILEGSNDGQNWLPYEFKFKVGDVKRLPPQVAPHQPRLDWQMWFAALSHINHNRWFQNLMFRVLEGRKEVLELIEHNPFPETPPKYLRATYYDYKFTTLAEKKESGGYWKREYKGFYTPPISLRK